MKPIAWSLLLVGALVAAAPAQAIDVTPHRATYEMSLQKAQPASGITSAEGRMIFEWGDSCDGWTVEQHYDLTMGYEESGTSKKRILAASLFYADTRVVDEVNGRWDAWVPWHDPPACNFLVTKLSGPRKRVAIQVTAAL